MRVQTTKVPNELLDCLKGMVFKYVQIENSQPLS